MRFFRLFRLPVFLLLLLLSACTTTYKTSRSVGYANAAINEMIWELKHVLPENVYIMPVNNGTSLKLTFGAGKLFVGNSNTITGDSKITLSKLAAYFTNKPSAGIRIYAFTDNTGRADYNLTLSERRAQRVYDYLSEQGVNPVRMAYSGRGINNPVATNNTAEGRALNRRVEIIIVLSPTITQ